MKRILTKLLIILAVFSLIIPMNTASVFAATSSQDGIIVDTKTDKNSYKEGEKATVFIAIQNTNGYDMKDINIKISLPENLSLTSQQIINIPSLKAGEILGYEIIVENDGEQVTIIPDSTKPNSNSTQDDIIASPNTSSSNMMTFFVILFGASLIIIFITKSGKKGKKILVIALAASMATSMFNMGTVEAKSPENEIRNFQVIQNINYDNASYPINLNVSYIIEYGQVVNQGEITREDWIVKLVDIMGYTTTFDSYSFDDYEKAKYPDKIETAIQYGLVDLHADQNNKVLFSPNEYATREFVAFSTINALGFSTYNSSIECDDSNILLYPDIDKLMIHYGMLKLVNNNFNPNQYVSNEEVTTIIDTICDFNDSLNIDPSTENTIDYNDTIKQYTLDFTIDEDNKIVTSSDKQLADLTTGDIVLLNNHYDLRDSIAIKIEKITYTDDKYIINYTDPSIDQVVDNIQVEGVIDNQDALFIPEDGVTIENTASAKSRSKLTEIPFNGSITASFNLEFGEHKEYSLSAKASLNLEELKYKVDCEKFGWLPVKLKEAHFECLLKSSASIEFKNTGDNNKTSIWTEEKEINQKLGTILIPTPSGVYGSVDVYLVTSLSGKIKLSIQADANIGIQYKHGNIRNIGYLDATTNDIDLNAEAKLGLKPEVSIKVAGCNLIKANTEAGVAANAKISNVVLDPLKYCVDTNLYLYWGIGGQLGPSFLNINYNLDIFNAKKSPFKRNLHFEETGLVDECTRKYGDYVGYVLSEEAQQPISQAKVQLYRDNELIESLETDSSGKFIGTKQKNGEYKLKISANNFETLEKEIEIVGGETIDLKNLYLKTANLVNLSGIVYDSETTAPISGVMISTTSPENTAISDENGHFSIMVNRNNAFLSFEKAGYKTKHVEIQHADQANIEIPMEKEEDVKTLTIHAGESYRLEKTSDTQLHIKATENTTFSMYGDRFGSYCEESWEAEKGQFLYGIYSDFYEFQVFSGELEVYACESYESEPIINLNDHWKITNLEGNDIFTKISLTTGQSIMIDYPVDDPIKDGPSTEFYIKSDNDSLFSTKHTDYWWNEHLGSDIKEEENNYSGKKDITCILTNLEKFEISVQAGKLDIYIPNQFINDYTIS